MLREVPDATLPCPYVCPGADSVWVQGGEASLRELDVPDRGLLPEALQLLLKSFVAGQLGPESINQGLWHVLYIFREFFCFRVLYYQRKINSKQGEFYECLILHHR